MIIPHPSVLKPGYVSSFIPLIHETCLKHSCGYAVASWGLALAPTFLVRRIGWQTAKPFYKDILYRNPYTIAGSTLLPILLTVFAVLYPSKSNPTFKKELWGLACLTTGTVAAPVFFIPRDALTVVGYIFFRFCLPDGR
eukprot:TRINITY_DN5422_c0_g1_i2.p1 TRINITY_DN5422_c0_g1~~TRINITY_DN5422_c0_g1_i2.p1  ORF type:complete len:139 (+),score=13.29 TRINITY_DN5422_c0_g1_i2:151-567(+)